MNGLARHLDQDERLASRERLARATDTKILLPALRNAWRQLSATGIAIMGCSVERVYERADGGFVISLSASFDRQGVVETQPLIAEIPTHRAEVQFADIIHRFTKRKRRHQLKEPAHPWEFCLVPELGLVARFAGLDEKIDGLELLHAPEKTGALPPDLFRSNGEAVRIRLVAHRLHRRAVVAAGRAGSMPVYLKFYKRGSGQPERNADLVRVLQRTAFQDTGPIRVPRTLGLLPSLGGFAMAGAPGRPLNELRGIERRRGMALAGEAAARLHRLPLRFDMVFTTGDEVKLLSQHVDLTAAIFPELRRCLEAGLERASARLALCRGFGHAAVHRDFHERQIIVDGSSCHLIDFDTVCSGDPNQDLGNFLAHLDLAELQGTPGAEDSAAVFLDAYARARSQPLLGNVAAHRQSTLLRLACIYAFSTQWSHLSPKLIEIALGKGP